MIRFAIIAVLFSVAGLADAQGPAKPGTPKADEKKVEPKKEPAKGDETPDEDVDVHKTAERIAENAQKAGGRLKDKDPGEDTRKIQQEILKDIDALLKKAQQPPPNPPDMPPPMSDMMPPPKSDMPPPMGGGGMPPPKGGTPPPKGGMGMSGAMPPPQGGTGQGGGSPQPKAGGSSGSSRAERRQRRERQQGGNPMGGNPMANLGGGGKEPIPASPAPKEGPMSGRDEKPSGDGGGVRFDQLSPKRQSDKLADLYKDVWGQLPDRMRQEMDLYYREQFMPRYSELLRQYYAALAEQRKKGPEDR